MSLQTQFDALAKKLQEYHDEASRIAEQLHSANLFLREVKQSAAKISSAGSTNLQSEAETIRLIQRINQTPFFDLRGGRWDGRDCQSSVPFV